LQLFELTSCGFAVVYRFRHADHSADQGTERANIGRNAPPRFAVGSIRFFIAFFLVIFFFGFMPLLVLTFIAADGSCSGSLAQSRISRDDAS